MLWSSFNRKKWKQIWESCRSGVDHTALLFSVRLASASPVVNRSLECLQRIATIRPWEGRTLSALFMWSKSLHTPKFQFFISVVAFFQWKCDIIFIFLCIVIRFRPWSVVTCFPRKYSILFSFHFLLLYLYKCKNTSA